MTAAPALTYISWENFDFLSNQLYRQLSNDNWSPDLVVGLTRGGLTLGVVLSHRLQLPMLALNLSLRDHVQHDNCQLLSQQLEQGRQLLVVDDINDTGATIRYIKQSLQLDNSSTQVKFAVLVHNLASAETVNYQSISINKDLDSSWVVFPWESSPG